VRKADNLPPSYAVVTKSGSLNLLEPSGPLQACNGTALPLPLHLTSCDINLVFITLSIRHTVNRHAHTLTHSLIQTTFIHLMGIMAIQYIFARSAYSLPLNTYIYL